MTEKIPFPDDRPIKPFAELHCHADGLLDASLVRTISGDEALAEEIDNAVPVDSLKKWMESYAPLLGRFLDPMPERLAALIMAHADRLLAQGVSYAELFVSRVILGIEDEGAMLDWFRTLRVRLDRRGAPRVNLVACIGRGSVGKAERQAGRIYALAREGLITGVALAGEETFCSVSRYTAMLDRCRDLGLGIEIHAGEFAGPESVRDALDHGRPHRLGHGVRAFEDPSLVERLAEGEVHLEFCPTGNLRLGIIPNIRRLPVRRALEAGIEFSLNTDDPGPFGTTVAAEFGLVGDAFQLNGEETDTIRRSAFKAAFDPGTKNDV